ncbi:unnamed protein product [Plutella xylostella]|uniref:(diamondback moth) hypothetical protein n=1 Tax=Plutella xylostella TaxID=51655 RepID=A0A8S4G383_PLUXY|nr:unnamed protein product [Plutella xylostella]
MKAGGASTCTLARSRQPDTNMNFFYIFTVAALGLVALLGNANADYVNQNRENTNCGAASGERRKQTLDNVRSMPQLAAARNAARLAARVDWRGARRRRAARCASETKCPREYRGGHSSKRRARRHQVDGLANARPKQIILFLTRVELWHTTAIRTARRPSRRTSSRTAESCGHGLRRKEMAKETPQASFQLFLITNTILLIRVSS